MNCKYCYRDFCRRKLPTELSDCVKEYLKQLDPLKTECVCMSGGEPLIYWSKIKEIFSYVPENVHKKIMTNGLLLTDEIVDYVNKYNVEICLSHDGEQTKFLRGIDIFENDKILELCRKIKILMVTSVITNRNEDVMANFRYIRNKLQRNNFVYRYCDLMNTGNVNDLLKDFDYALYARSSREYTLFYKKENPFYNRVERKGGYAPAGFNVDLDGNIVGMNTLVKYGTIYNTFDECYQKMLEIDNNFCKDKHCPIFTECNGLRQASDEHYCKCQKIRMGWS